MDREKRRARKMGFEGHLLQGKNGSYLDFLGGSNRFFTAEAQRSQRVAKLRLIKLREN
jgi:hypothetical protein